MNSRFQIITNTNGTHTLRDTIVGQEMHSRVGPWTEAQTLYAQGSRIAEKLADRGNLVLHDVGMGTSANVIATLEALETRPTFYPSGTQLEVESFETEISGLGYALQNLETFPFLKSYRDHLESLLANREIEFTLPRSQVKVTWRLFEAGYFESLHGAKKPQVIYYDFYSMKAEPHLWNEGSFQTLRSYLGNRPCELYTYSAATPVRLSLLLAGFYVGYGAKTEMKTETTVATNIRELLTRPLEKSWLDKLRVSSSITDEDLRDRGLKVLENYF